LFVLRVTVTSSLIAGDPYCNLNLSLLREDYSLAFNRSEIRSVAMLLDIYYLRPGLQEAHPEVRDGELQELIEWAAISGIKVDASRVLLQPYGSYFASNSSHRTR